MQERERNDADKEGGRGREQEDKQTELHSAQTKTETPTGACAGRGNRELPGSTDRKSSGCQKGQAVDILSALANPHGGEGAPGTHDAHQQRDPPPSLPRQPPGKLQLDRKTHTQHTGSFIRPTGPQGKGHSPASFLPNSQASQCLHRPSPAIVCGLRAFQGKAPPTALCSPGVLQLPLSNSASARPSGVLCPVPRQISATYCQDGCPPTSPL